MTTAQRKTAGLVALRNMAEPTVRLMALAPAALAVQIFEGYRMAVGLVLDDFPEIAAKADADAVAKRMIDDAANDRKADA